MVTPQDNVKIKEMLKRGVSNIAITDALTATEALIKQKNKELLQKHITDQTILSIMLQESNQEKIKHRYEYYIQLQDKQGQNLAEIRKMGDATLRQVIGDLKRTMTMNIEIKGHSPTVSYELNLHGTGNYKYQHLNDGKLNNIYVQAIFRRGS